MHLHFTGRTWRPHYEADSVIIQATSGCTYNQCWFCNLYAQTCSAETAAKAAHGSRAGFRMSPMEEFEADLAEIKQYQPNARRVFWTGANPFANSVSSFYPVTAYLPKERSSVLGALQHVIDTVSEEEMTKYRRSLKALG